MTISDSTISVDAWAAIRTKLVTAAPYTNNLTTTTTTAATINAVFNDKVASRPQIVIHPILLDEAEWKFGGLQGKKTLNIVVDCFAQNTLFVDQLWDQVRAALDDNDLDGMDLIAISTNYDFNSPGDQKYHLKSGTFTYERE